MPERLDIDMDLLARWLAGEGTPDDWRAVDQWIAAHPDRRAWISALTSSILTDDAPRLDVSRARARIAERTGIALNGQQRTGQKVQRSTPLMPGRSANGASRGVWYGVVGFAFALIALVGGWQLSNRYTNTQLAHDVSVYTTQPGQRSSVTLPDGSTVHLSVASRLEVPANYSMGNRTLKLRGEAFFTVAHRDGTPFTVVAGNSVTRVLGTRFLVRAYDTDTEALVAVRDGKVAVGSQVLTAMQQVTVSPHGVSPVQPTNAAQFEVVNGILALSNTPLREAIASLNRWYGVEIRLGDRQLMTRNLTAELSAGTVADLIEVLEYSFNLRVVREGRVLTLYSK
jgi:transmembrane sensor